MRIDRSGYWYIKANDHPSSGKQGYVAEHRLVVEKKLGRFLKPSEAVHHVNGDRKDNRIENLQLCESKGKHTLIHHPEVIEKLIQYSKQRKKIIKYSICSFCHTQFPVQSYKQKYCKKQCYWDSKKNKKATRKQLEALKKGRGWNRGIKCDWQKTGKDSPHYKHGKYSKHLK